MRGSAITLGLLVFLLPVSGSAQRKPLFPHDTVPRDRLVTTAELLALLEPSPPAVVQALARHDTALALNALADHFQFRTTPRYFFTPAELPQRLDEYQRRHPDDLQTVRSSALGYMKTYGADIDWRVPGRDLRGRPHSPNTVRQLARQLYAENFALLSSLPGGDESLVRFQMDVVRDFLSDFEGGRTETGGNDVFERFYAGHRVRNWMMMHNLLLPSCAYSADDRILMLKAFLLHGGKIVDQCKKFNWGNHQLVGLCALYEMTLMFPEFPVMREWKAHVLTLLLEHLENEVPSDGFQFERASHYFKLEIINYARALCLARLNDEELPPWVWDRFRSMFQAIASVAMPDRSMPVLQDAQDTYIGNRNIEERTRRLGISETGESAELTDPAVAPFMTLGAYLFRDPTFKYFGSATIHPVFFWLLDTSAQQEYDSLATEPPSFGSIALGETRYYVMRSGWEPADRYLLIDGGLAQHKPDHTHGGILGVISYAFGQTVLPNYRVRYSDTLYPVMKNSFVKNVALADRIPQGRGWIGNAAHTGFGKWAYLPQPEVTGWATGRHVDYFAGRHGGFDTAGVSYSRTIVFLRPDYWIFFDDFSAARGDHSYQQIWQGVYEPLADKRSVVQTTGSARVFIVQGGEGPFQIVQSVNGGQPSVQFHRTNRQRYCFATGVFPLPAGSEEQPVIVGGSTDDGMALVVTSGRRLDAVVLSRDRRAAAGDLKSDARVLVADRAAEGAPHFAFFADVTRVDGQRWTLSTESRVTLELAMQDGEVVGGIVLEGSVDRLSFVLRGEEPCTVYLNERKEFSISSNR